MANKPKKIKLKPTESGSQFYQSDRQRQARRDNAKKSATGRYIETDLEKKINKAIEERMLEGKMTPKEAGKFKAQYFIDMMDDTYSNKAKGGAVRAMQNGGAVMKGRGPKFKGQS